MDRHREKEMDENQREGTPDLRHDQSGVQERKGSRQHPRRLQASDPGGDRQQSGRGGSGNVPATLASPPLPLLLCRVSGRGSPTKPKSQSLLPHLWGSFLPFCPWLGEVGGRGSWLPLRFSLAFSGHPLAAALGSPRSVSGHGVYSWESHPE